MILVGEIQNNLSDLYIDHPWRKLIVTQYPYHLVFLQPKCEVLTFCRAFPCAAWDSCTHEKHTKESSWALEPKCRWILLLAQECYVAKWKLSQICCSKHSVKWALQRWENHILFSRTEQRKVKLYISNKVSISASSSSFTVGWMFSVTAKIRSDQAPRKLAFKQRLNEPTLQYSQSHGVNRWKTRPIWPPVTTANAYWYTSKFCGFDDVRSWDNSCWNNLIRGLEGNSFWEKSNNLI